MPNFRPARLGRAALAGLIGLCATGALAATPENATLVVSPQTGDTRSIEVRVSDLNLADAYARETLAIRIDRAAKKVCDVQSGSTLDRLPSARECVDRAQSGAFAQLAARGLPWAGRSAAGGMQ
ncbi:MAG: UrcA family protein [Porphyrobacter sp.]|nr:UrcA family protein [Porphyrobacter sp.]